MKVKVNNEACIGCGLCTGIAAAVFAFGADGKAENVLGDVPADLADMVNEAVASCPVAAIEAE